MHCCVQQPTTHKRLSDAIRHRAPRLWRKFNILNALLYILNRQGDIIYTELRRVDHTTTLVVCAVNSLISSVCSALKSLPQPQRAARDVADGLQTCICTDCATFPGVLMSARAHLHLALLPKRFHLSSFTFAARA